MIYFYTLTAHPDGFWFGTQSLTCLFGYTRTRRSATRRSTLLPRHRLIYFRRFIYEWGVGEEHDGHRVAKYPSTTTCPITWEKKPAGISRCSPKYARAFTRRYERKFGQYSLLANNCHHFANRLVRLLKSSTCRPPRGRKTMWRRMSYYFSFRRSSKPHKMRKTSTKTDRENKATTPRKINKKGEIKEYIRKSRVDKKTNE